MKHITIGLEASHNKFLVISLDSGLKNWHFNFILGPTGWNRKRWIMKHIQWPRRISMA